MDRWTARLASLALSAALTGEALAQSPPTPNEIKTIGTCIVIQTNASTAETPIGLRAVGSCEAGAPGNPTCTAEIIPTNADIILDVSDRDYVPQCLGLTGDNSDSCVSAQNGPVLFQSQRHATQSFTASADRVRMTTMIRQIRVQQTTIDLPPTPKFPLNAGRLFDVLKSRSSVAARLECSMADGDQRIFPIVGSADLSPNIRFVSRNSSEPAFDILTYRVAP
jgi:hypothetical protein